MVKTIYDDTVKTVDYDVLDHVIEERDEDLNGNILKRMSYQYDEMGRKIKTISATGATTSIQFDTHGIPVETIDEEGNVTRSVADFSQKVNKLETTDPSRVKTTTIFNCIGKPKTKKIINAYGTILHETQYSYDIAGNKTKILEIPYLNGEAPMERLQHVPMILMETSFKKNYKMSLKPPLNIQLMENFLRLSFQMIQVSIIAIKAYC